MKKLLLFLLSCVACLTSASAGEYFSETLSSTAVQVKAGPTNVMGVHIYNPNGVPIFVHKYDALAGSVSVGTTAQKNTPWCVAANGYLWLSSNGHPHGYYATGLTIAATTTATTTGSTAPSSPLIVTINYQ